MVQSIARLNVHLVFSTKNRQALLHESIRASLHNYIAVVLQNFGSPAVLINSVEDHVHILFDLGRTASVSQAVEEIKTTSSKWLKTRGPQFVNFAWQTGYAAFAVSKSNVAAVREYIASQDEHHRKLSFQDEFRAILKRHGLAFDERFIWD